MMRPFHILIVHKISFFSGVVFHIVCLINSFVLLILHFDWLCDYLMDNRAVCNLYRLFIAPFIQKWPNNNTNTGE